MPLRQYGNWPDWGIFYAQGGMQNRNFWGVINHDNQEGLIRVADNQFTSGMKFWTFGYPTSKGLDMAAMRQTSNRPFIELWAGSVSEFFRTAPIAPGETQKQAEVYAPTIGLPDITSANDNFLVSLHVADGQASAQIAPLFPGQALDYTLSQDGKAIGSGRIGATADLPIKLSAPASGSAAARLTLSDAAGNHVFDSAADR